MLFLFCDVLLQALLHCCNECWDCGAITKAWSCNFNYVVGLMTTVQYSFARSEKTLICSLAGSEKNPDNDAIGDDSEGPPDAIRKVVNIASSTSEKRTEDEENCIDNYIGKINEIQL
jgi:hypothetical protein